MNKNVLITGGTGFLGSNLCRTLLNDGYKIILLKRKSSNIFRIEDIIANMVVYDLDDCNLTKVLSDNSVEIIIHCATDYGRKQVSPLQITEANLILPLKLLQLGKECGIKYFINTDTILDKRVSHYSLSKKQFIDWLKTYQDCMVCVNMALEHFYGPNDDKTKFVSYIFDSLIRDVPSINLTLGEQKRDFVYIDDVVEAFIVVVRNLEKLSNGYHHYEIGTNELISIRELVEMIKVITKNKNTVLNFGALPYRENEKMFSFSDTSNIKNLGWAPMVKIKDGLELMFSQIKK